MIDILHLSDLHFTASEQVFRFGKVPPDALAESVLQPVLNRCTPQAVVLSGDFAQDGDSTDFQLARPFISALLARLGLDASRVVLIPGNHDIRWKRGDKQAEGDERVAAYRDFFELVRRRNANTHLSDYLATPDYTVLAFNSSLIEGPKRPGFGFVGEEQLAQIWRQVQADPGYSPDAPRIAVVHHHLLPVTWLEPENDRNLYSLTLDAQSVQEWLLNNDFRVVLHGHQHQPFLRGVTKLGRNGEKHLLIAGAGSACAAQPLLGTFNRNHYQVVRVGKSHIEVQWYQSHYQNPNAFEYDRTYCYPYGANDRKTPQVRLMIGISGGTSDQRAQFTRALVERLQQQYRGVLNVALMPSPARDVITEGRGHNEETRPVDYAVYLDKHLRNLNDAPQSGLVVFDRTLLDTLAFAELNGNLESEWLSLVQQTAQAVARRMDLYFYLQRRHAPLDDRTYDDRVDNALWTVLQRIRPDVHTLPADLSLDAAVKVITERVEEITGV